METEETFDLKIQAFYLNTDQKCFQANRTIRLRELKRENKAQDSRKIDDLTPNETRKQTTMSLLNDVIKSEPNKTTNQFHSDRRSKLNIFTISLSSAFVIFVIFSFSVAATVLCRRTHKEIMKVDENEMYGVVIEEEEVNVEADVEQEDEPDVEPDVEEEDDLVYETYETVEEETYEAEETHPYHIYPNMC